MKQQKPTQASPLAAYEAIAAILEPYLQGARTGSGETMRPTFHEKATIFGYLGPDLIADPIETLFAWNDENGPAPDLCARIAAIEVYGSAATARVEIDHWTGQRFTDLFTLLEIDGAWQVVCKAFHAHT